MSDPIADTAGAFHQFARLQAMTEWWHWLVLVAVCAGILAGVVWLYRRDSVELPRPLAWALLTLRVVALLGILFYYLDLEKRTERTIVKPSRVLLLVDTSQSMGLPDAETGRGEPVPTRIQRVVDELARGTLLASLRAGHDVVVYRFDQQSQPTEVAALPRLGAPRVAGPTLTAAEAFAQSLAEARMLTLVAGGLLFFGVFFGLVYLLVFRRERGPDTTSWTLLASLVLLIVTVVVAAVAGLRNPQVEFLAMIGWRDGVPPEDRSSPLAPAPALAAMRPEEIPWAEQLVARGVDTRLGEALRFVVQKERGGPVAGIVVFSDGRSNAGLDCQDAMQLAKNAEIPVYAVGLGGDQRPLNVRVVDLEAPERVYPGDKFTVTGHLQATGVSGRTLDVRLTSSPAGGPAERRVETVEQEDRVELKTEGELVTVKFEVTPSEPGRRTYRLAVKPPAGDHDPRDDAKLANVEVVERKTRVLLMAGGPTREYAFLRNLLYRDRDTTLDVWLQSGQPGMSQESHQLLQEFPQTLQELFAYDCVVAFDPDWTELDLVQVKNLEQWVADKAGGLIVVAGPVHTPQWSSAPRGDSRWDTIRNLYPVVLYSSGAASLGLGRFGGENAWPLQFTREGLEAEFLWLEDGAVASEAAWASFAGVYGYYAVKDPKPGATVYARFSDPETAIDGQLPIYLASHFYGAGRVFFQASGEIWRLRAVDDSYFDRYYTQLVRWVSQGRLQQDSPHGVLLVDKERALLGDPVGVQAILTDDQNRPLTAPQVDASLVRPDGGRAVLTLRLVKGAAREGTYAGQFMAVAEGDYRVELRPPHGEVEELLVSEVRVRVPALEVEKSERHDALLAALAQTTGGAYYVGLEAALGRAGGGPALANAVTPRDLMTTLPGTPDRDFELRLMKWLLALIVGALSLEWLIRRLSKLA